MGDSSLDALLGLAGSDTDAEAEGNPVRFGQAKLIEIPVQSITPNRFQPRTVFSEHALDELAASIRALGVLQPVLVRPATNEEGEQTGYELVAGERRWRGSIRAGLATIPAIVREGDERASLEQAVVENLHRSDLSAVEEASAYRQLMEDFGLTQLDVAARVGRSRSSIANTLRLLNLPMVVQRLVLEGSVSAGHARALLAFPDSAFQSELAQRIVAEDLSVRQTEDLVRRAGRRTVGQDRRTNGSVTKPAAALEIEEILGSRLDTRVDVSVSSGTGKLTVEFADMDDLDRITQILIGES